MINQIKTLKKEYNLLPRIDALLALKLKPVNMKASYYTFADMHVSLVKANYEVQYEAATECLGGNALHYEEKLAKSTAAVEQSTMFGMENWGVLPEVPAYEDWNTMVVYRAEFEVGVESGEIDIQ